MKLGVKPLPRQSAYHSTPPTLTTNQIKVSLWPESRCRPTSDCRGSQFLERLVRGNSPLELKRLVLPLPHSTPMCLFRTWSNGWFTSRRMHEPEALPCIFGCGADDDLCHYLKCEALWTCVYSCSKCNTSIVAQTIPECACVHNVNLSNI